MSHDSHPDDLLAFYANGTLAGAEHDTVARHLSGCRRCRDEVAFLDALRQGVKGADAALAPGELGWMRLRRDVRAQMATVRWRWQPALAAAAAVLIVVQAALLMNFWRQETSITPLGGAKPDGIVLQVRFQPDATEARIRSLLQEAGASVIDGPGALGIYRLRLDAGADAARSLSALHANKDVVAHAVAE
jgi:hypothetical protein